MPYSNHEDGLPGNERHDMLDEPEGYEEDEYDFNEWYSEGRLEELIDHEDAGEDWWG